MAQDWAQFFVSEKPDEAKLFKRSGEPPRTRTWNPLIPQEIYLVGSSSFVLCGLLALAGMFGSNRTLNGPHDSNVVRA